MPRQARKKSSSGIYHVMLRGINKQQIFEDEEDCDKFLWVSEDRGRFSVLMKSEHQSGDGSLIDKE